MSTDGLLTKWRRNIAENCSRLSRAHERYRQTDDGRTTTYSEREREFTLSKTVGYIGAFSYHAEIFSSGTKAETVLPLIPKELSFLENKGWCRCCRWCC